ncbi:MAG: hypothetical protein ACKVOQ_22460 [Cyclobacteriaceae bacterium]
MKFRGKNYLILSLVALLLATGSVAANINFLSSVNYEWCEESESSIEINEFVAGRNQFTIKKVKAEKPTAANSFPQSFQPSIPYPQQIAFEKDRHILFRSLLI